MTTMPEETPSDSEASEEQTNSRFTKRRRPKVPWCNMVSIQVAWEGSPEQCGCGSIFVDDDTFCYRCGSRRPEDRAPRPVHVARMPEPPIDDVGDRMVAWAEAYRQRKVAMQSLKAQNEDECEKATHAGIPHVNPLSLDLTTDLKPISERYKGVIWMKEFRLQRKRDEIGKEKAEAYVLNPEINPRSTNLDRDVEDLTKFLKHRDHKVELKRHKRFQEQMQECTFQPILEACNRRSSIAHQHKVHDRLYADATQRTTNLKADQVARQREWKSGGGKARSGSSDAPKADAVAFKENKMPAAPPGFKQFMRSISMDPQIMGKVRVSSPKRERLTSAYGEADAPVISRRGPRASACVLPQQKDEIPSSKKSGGLSSRRNQDGSMSRSATLSPRFSGVDSSDGPVAPRQHHRLVWTGGRNTVTATAEYVGLLERCQPFEDDDEQHYVRGRTGSMTRSSSGLVRSAR
jgi:hypothetical protein